MLDEKQDLWGKYREMREEIIDHLLKSRAHRIIAAEQRNIAERKIREMTKKLSSDDLEGVGVLYTLILGEVREAVMVASADAARCEKKNLSDILED